MQAKSLISRFPLSTTQQPLQIQKVTVRDLASVNGKPVIIVDMENRVPTLTEVNTLASIVNEKGNGNVILTNADRADAVLEIAGLQHMVQVTNNAGAPILARQTLARKQRLSNW